MEKTFLTNIELWAELIPFFSAIVFGVAILFVLITALIKKELLSFNKRVFLFTVAIAASIWSLQFLADYVNPDCPADTWFELLVFSFYHTLKSFGAEDSFLMGIENALTLIPADWAFEYRLLCSLLAFCAPVTTATIVFEVLSNFFPKIKLYLYSVLCFKKKYFFSKLNERSVALAKSILETEKGLAPVIIFSDVYENRTEENTSELFAKAKEIKALCFRTDIVHTHKIGLGKRKIFLIDDDESVNIQAFVNLTNKSKKHLRKNEVYLFCKDYVYADIEEQLEKNLYGEKDSPKSPYILPVRYYRNFIAKMLEETPLYEPIVQQRKEHPDDELDLNVTIIGTGDIGREMFLATYWMGQMLNCKLNINIISNESEKYFWGKIDYINPEIRHTVHVNVDEEEKEKANKEGAIKTLRIYGEGKKDENGNPLPDELNFAKPYAYVKYISCDVESEDFSDLLEYNKKDTTIFDTHYFLISLGSDKANLSVAKALERGISNHHLGYKDDKSKTIINYVVYNTALNEALNINKFSSADKNIYMQAVGGIEQIFNEKSIFLSDYQKKKSKRKELAELSELADKLHHKLLPLSNNKDSRKKQLSDAKREISNYRKKKKRSKYNEWSSLARSLHFKYKLFSANLIESTVFDTYTEKDDSETPKNEYETKKNEYIESTYSAIRKYKRMARRELKVKYTPEQEMEFQHSIQWLEHRRWCALLRTTGFSSTKDYEGYCKKTGDHKQMDVKLHPCLVECDKNGIHGTIDNNGNITDTLITVIKNSDDTKTIKINATGDEIATFDLLDQLTCNLAKFKSENPEDFKNSPPYDFKKYDYPIEDDYTKKSYLKWEKELKKKRKKVK